MIVKMSQDLRKTMKKMKESGDKQPSRKIIQNNDSEDDPGSWENNEKYARNVYHRPTRINEQTNI